MSVFSNAIKDTVKFKLWKFVIGGVSPIVAVLTLGQKLFNLNLLQSCMYGLLGVLFFILVIFIWYLIKYAIAYAHNLFVDSIWGEAIKILQKAYSEVHKLERQDEVNDADYIKVLVLFCNSLKQILDVRCRRSTPWTFFMSEATKVYTKYVLLPDIQYTLDVLQANNG